MRTLPHHCMFTLVHTPIKHKHGGGGGGREGGREGRRRGQRVRVWDTGTHAVMGHMNIRSLNLEGHFNSVNLHCRSLGLRRGMEGGWGRWWGVGEGGKR